MKQYLLIGVLLSGFLSPSAWSRTWTNNRGKTVEAEWVRQEGGKVVVVKNEAGKEFRIPLNTLSREDQDFVHKMNDMGFMEKSYMWTMSDGKLVAAVLKRVGARVVTLSDKNGESIRILITDLNKDDKRYVVEQMKKGLVEIGKGENTPGINTVSVDELFQAVKKSDLATIKSYVDHGGSLDVCDSSGSRSPLCAAAEEGQLAAAKFLLASGAKINFIPQQGACSSPLMFASSFGRVEQVKLFLVSGAEINYENTSGMTTLMDGISSDNTQIVKLLLAQGADLAYTSKRTGQTALEYARRKNARAEIIKLLEGAMIDKGIKMPVSKTVGLTNDQVGILNDALRVLQTMSSNRQQGLADLVSALSEALIKVKMGKATVNDPCTPFKRYGMMVSPLPLECAAATGSWELVGKLDKLGAHGNENPDFARHAAFNALGEKNINALKCLLDSGLVTEETKHLYGNNLLIWTVIVDTPPEMLQYLIDKGFNINTTNSFKKTALMEAAQYNRLELVRTLLKNKADIQMKAKDGTSALDKARLHKASPQLVRLLEEAGR